MNCLLNKTGLEKSRRECLKLRCLKYGCKGLYALLCLSGIGLLVESNYWSLEAAEAQEGGDKKRQSFLMGAFRPEDADSNQPIYISSRSLEVDSEKRVFVYSGGVEVVQGDLHITADRMQGNYASNQKLEKILCYGQVVITKGANIRANANKAVFYVEREIVELTESPELFRDGNLLTADLVRILVAQDKSEAEGNVRVKVVGEQGGVGRVFAPATKKEPESSGF